MVGTKQNKQIIVANEFYCFKYSFYDTIMFRKKFQLFLFFLNQLFIMFIRVGKDQNIKLIF